MIINSIRKDPSIALSMEETGLVTAAQIATHLHICYLAPGLINLKQSRMSKVKSK